MAGGPVQKLDKNGTMFDDNIREMHEAAIMERGGVVKIEKLDMNDQLIDLVSKMLVALQRGK